MDELEKKTPAPGGETEQGTPKRNGLDNRRKLLYTLCGGYLIYLAVKLGRAYPELAAGGVWSGDRIVTLCGAIAFALIGAGMLVFVTVRVIREWKQTSRKQTEEHTEEHTDE